MKSSVKCIFCDNNDLTKEHIFGRWLKNQLKSTDAVHFARNTRTYHKTSTQWSDINGGRPYHTVGKGLLNRNGQPFAHQLRVVCKRCNNGWMSSIQNHASLQLAPLVRGQWVSLTNEAMTQIASYAAMVTMVLEFGDKGSIATTYETRNNFRNSGIPGRDWQIYLGMCHGDVVPGTWWHRGALVLQEDAIDTGAILPRTKLNSQITTFYLGRCFLHTISGPDHFLPNYMAYTEATGLVRIWPYPAPSSSAPNSLSPEDVKSLAGAYWNMLGENSQPHFGL